MKHLKLFAALCCAAVLFAACDKSNEPSNGSNNQNEPTPVVQKHDTTLYFAPFALDPIVPDNVKEVLASPNIANIYMEPIGEKFDRSGAEYIHSIRINGLEPNIDMDPQRVHGRGNFVFYPGEVYPEDSLWFVQHGWTVNQQNQR